MTVEFSEEIDRLETSLEQKRAQLSALEAQRKSHSVQTRKARNSIEDLRAVLRGESPPSKRGRNSSTRGVSAVPVNKETGRPARGARRQQIQEICKQIGAGGEVFRTADVLQVLRDVESEVSTGMRSYTYTVMNALEEEGLVVRKGRGKWIWKG